MIILFSDPENYFIFSSLIREIAFIGGDLSKFVPVKANAAIKNVKANLIWSEKI